MVEDKVLWKAMQAAWNDPLHKGCLKDVIRTYKCSYVFPILGLAAVKSKQIQEIRDRFITMLKLKGEWV